MSQLINLLYGSSATRPLSDNDLLDLLTEARTNNRQLNITGMLLYRGGNFFQVLEGERDVVESLYPGIARDPRHNNVRLIAKRPVTNRVFEQWEMGFARLDAMDLTKVEGFSPFLDEPLNSDRFKDMAFAYTFLNVFKAGLR